jgi:type III pantothenate kinase
MRPSVASLLLDLGNSRLKWQLCSDEGSVLGQGALVAAGRPAVALASELAEACVPGLMALDEQGLLCRAALVSVGPSDQTEALLLWAERATARPVCLVHACAAQAGLDNDYCDPPQLGSDRWVAGLGALEALETLAAHAPTALPVPQAQQLLVVSAGTATVMDSVSRLAGGWHFEGGVILPGFDLMREALVQGTAALGPLFKAAPQALSERGWPRDSAQALAMGIELAQASPVLGLPAVQCIFVHGGHAKAWLDAHHRLGTGLQQPMPAAVHVPDLIFLGLRRALAHKGV